jgi:hypothetical protein
MNLPYIQSELFRELVGMETLLKPEYRFLITKRCRGVMNAILYTKQGNLIPGYRNEFHLNPFAIKTTSDITAEINRIWNAIPDECKREDILK